MRWQINGTTYMPQPISAFRRAHALPKTFGVAHFQPKDFDGLASIEGAGNALLDMRNTLLDGLPAHVPIPSLLPLCNALTHAFEQALLAINAQVGLRDVELGFAVAGFSDFLQAWGFAVWQAHAQGNTTPDSASVYAAWLEASVRLEQTPFAYEHAGEVWQVWVVHDLYGRAGLLIQAGNVWHAVADVAYSCPANAYMEGLLCDIAEAIAGRLG